MTPADDPPGSIIGLPQRRSTPSPSPWRIIAGALLFAGVYGLCALHYLSVPPSPDQSIFDYIGYLGLRGTPWYRGAFDLSWPGPLLYHQLGVALFGVHGWTARATDLCLLPIGLAGLWLHLSGHVRPILWKAALLAYPVVYVTSGAWMAGHRDIVAMHMLLCATGLLIKWRDHRAARIGAGLLLGYALAVRPTYGLILVPIAIIELGAAHTAREARRAMIDLAAGMTAVAGGFGLLLVAQDAIIAWFEQCILIPMTVYYQHNSIEFLGMRLFTVVKDNWRWLSIASLAGLANYLLRRPSPARAGYILALMLTPMLSFLVQAKGFDYQLGGLIPVFFLSAVLGTRQIAAPGPPRGRALAIGMLGVLCAGTLAAGIIARAKHLQPIAALLLSGDAAGLREQMAFRKGPSAKRRAVADLVRKESRPDEALLQWGWHYEIGFLAQRPTATRYLNGVIMSAISRNDPRFGPWLDGLRADIARSRPRFMLFDTSLLHQYGTFRTSRSPALRILFAFRRDYAIRRITPDIVVLKRRDDDDATPPRFAMVDHRQ